MQKFDSLFKSKNIFFIAIVIFVLSSFTLYHNRSDILKLFKSESKNLSQTIDTIEKSKPSINEGKNEAPLLSTKSLLNYVSSLQFPEAPAEQKLDTIVNKVSEPKSIDYTPKSYSIDYIHYLLNINLLVYNFMQDKNYNKELRIVNSYPLPQDIRNILANLEAYNNNYLFSKSESMEVIFPKNHKWLEKFIKIEKKPFNITIKEHDKNLVLEKLNYLIDFLYSEQFMQEFVNKDV